MQRRNFLQSLIAALILSPVVARLAKAEKAWTVDWTIPRNHYPHTYTLDGFMWLPQGFNPDGSRIVVKNTSPVIQAALDRNPDYHPAG